jgi:hypothetical protein
MGKYAANTEVSEEKSRAEIEGILRRYGAQAFSYGWEEDRALIAFRAHSRHVRFEIAMPKGDEEVFWKYKDRYGYERTRSETAALNEYYQARRQRWRALALVVKAKLEAVDSGISEFEEEFLAHIVLPDGSTVGSRIRPHIERAYVDGKMPLLLLAPGKETAEGEEPA